MYKRFVIRTAVIMLAAGFLISTLITKFFIESSYAQMEAEGLTGTPSVIGIFVLLLFIWVLGLAVFILIDAFRSILSRGNGSTFGGFLKEVLLFFLLWLLFIPVSFAAMYAGAMFVQMP